MTQTEKQCKKPLRTVITYQVRTIFWHESQRRYIHPSIINLIVETLAVLAKFQHISFLFGPEPCQHQTTTKTCSLVFQCHFFFTNVCYANLLFAQWDNSGQISGSLSLVFNSLTKDFTYFMDLWREYSRIQPQQYEYSIITYYMHTKLLSPHKCWWWPACRKLGERPQMWPPSSLHTREYKIQYWLRSGTPSDQIYVYNIN